MRKKLPKIHIGLRTIKTAAAIVISMFIVDFLGTSASKLIFAMLGAMAAVQPTFKESWDSCLAQIVGVLFGSFASIVLLMLPVPSLVATGIGMVLVITLYNALHIRYSPSLPCFIVVMMCTTPDIVPLAYASERIWDTTIGLSVGMLINTLVFPYDNSRQIRATVESLGKELILFLEDMFDGDDILPDADAMSRKVDAMYRQMQVFSNQKYLHRQQEKLESSVTGMRRSQVGTGMRNERIRTYNFPQGRVTDHRIGLTLCKIDQIMDGGIDELIDALATADQAEKLKNAQY